MRHLQPQPSNHSKMGNTMKSTNRIIAVLALTLATGGCSTAGDNFSVDIDLLPESSSSSSFIVGWQADRAGQSAVDLHRKLDTAYNAAAIKASEELGLELSKRVVTNAGNLLTATDTADFRQVSRYAVHAPDRGCEVIIEDNGRTYANCGITVFTGGLKKKQTPNGIMALTSKSWAFDQGMNHKIRLEGADGTDLPIAAFDRSVSSKLPKGVFVFSPAQGDQWLHLGKELNE